MKIGFKSKNEEELYQSERSLTTAYGPRMAKKIIQRITELQAAENPQHLPGNARFHEHSGKREGLFSLDLVHPFRLIVFPTCDYVSWVEIKSVEIYEVMSPH
jgi:plasmid maintenance system killer protein